MRPLIKPSALAISACLLAACVTTQGGTKSGSAKSAASQSANTEIASTEPATAVDTGGREELMNVDISAEMLPGSRPELNTDEGGLWMAMDRHEDKVRTGARVINDPELNAYISGIVCRLAGDHCGAIRTYVVRMPAFNASMAPNGTMLVWSGLLLRAENEAQLAAVLGHEVGHYLKRHSLKNWRKARDTAAFLQFFNMAAAAAGVAPVGLIATLAASGGLASNSRDFERQADGIGHILMAQNGYDPAEAAKLWDNIVEENKAAKDKNSRVLFFASHPPSSERSQTLGARASLIAEDGETRGLYRDRYWSVVGKFRREFLRDELETKRYGRFEVFLDRLEKTTDNPGELHFFRGEMYRLRNGKDDGNKAMESYASAVATGGDYPPEAHRSLGVMLMRKGDKTEAARHLKLYLEKAPDAIDRGLISQIIEGLV